MYQALVVSQKPELAIYAALLVMVGRVFATMHLMVAFEVQPQHRLMRQTAHALFCHRFHDVLTRPLMPETQEQERIRLESPGFACAMQ